MKINIEVDGVEQRFEGVCDIDNLERVMGQACALIERDAKKKAPKDTGNLRRSITSKVETKNNEISGIVFTPLEYAPYRYVRSLNRVKSGKPKQLKYQTI